jgi:hypothetical protein
LIWIRFAYHNKKGQAWLEKDREVLRYAKRKDTQTFSILPKKRNLARIINTLNSKYREAFSHL